MERRAFILGAFVGLLTACSPVPTRPAERPVPDSDSGQASVTDVDYSFKTRDGLTLIAKLTLPAHTTQRAPVAIFIGGTGTWNADYAHLDAQNKLASILPIPALARQCAQNGIAFISYQKRFSTDQGDVVVEHWNKLRLDDLLDDVRILLAKAKVDPRLDASRIALVGHSEGTMIGTWIGGSDPDVKAFVFMGLAQRNLKEVFRFQAVNRNAEIYFTAADSQPKDGFMDVSEILLWNARIHLDNWRAFDVNRDSRLSKDEFMALLNWIYDEELRNIEEARPEAIEHFSAHPVGWYRQHFRHSTVRDAWQYIRTPVLAITGKLDTAAPVQTEAEPFEAMLSALAHPDHQLITPEGLDHTFKDKGEVSHASLVFEAIVPWLKDRLKVR